MQCPKCNSPMHPSEAGCPHCGAERPPRRVIFGEEKAEFRLTPEEESFELGDPPEATDWNFSHERRLEPNPPVTEIPQTSCYFAECDAAYGNAHVGMDGAGDGLFRDVSWDGRKDHREVDARFARCRN